MKRWTYIRAIIFAFLLFIQPVSAKTVLVNAYLFYGDGCPHCAKERQYLSDVLERKYSNLKIHAYEIYNDTGNALLLRAVSEKLNVRMEGVPFLVIGDQPFSGFTNGVTPSAVEQRVKECSSGGCTDSIATLVGVREEEIVLDDTDVDIDTTDDVQEPPVENTGVQEQTDQDKKIIALPFLGQINAADVSLPFLTVMIGVLDGFNPCAMWTLLFLISLLLGMKDRRKMFILGITFIVASASVYFLFMSAWLNLMLFLGFIMWVRVSIGILSLIGGSYSVTKSVTDKESGCKIEGDEERRKTFEKMKLAIQQNSLLLAMGGITLLAFAVNLVELICSAGLPAIYTQVLAMNHLATWQYYLYILLYIFFFMLDDLIIFLLAVYTLEMTGITTKYARASRLIGGLAMLAIGLMLIFKPGWLMFG